MLKDTAGRIRKGKRGRGGRDISERHKGKRRRRELGMEYDEKILIKVFNYSSKLLNFC